MPRSLAAGSRRFLLCLLAAALLVAACGSDTVDDTAAGSGADDTAAGSGADDTTDQSDGNSMDGDSMEGDSMDGDSMDGDSMDGGHMHNVLEVPEGMAVPSVEVRAEPDGPTGVTLLVDVADFTINPAAASGPAADGEGHLHFYLNGERQMRFYNTALQVGGLSPGTHELMVEVSANDHSAYAVDGEPIRAAVTVEIEGSGGHGDGHSHGGDTELFQSASPPSVELVATEDPKSGWNLQAILSDDFSFAPEALNGEAVDGEGHLHLYVDGQKITRLYGPWWHLDGLSPGQHRVEVEVSANDHRAYGVDGEPLRAEVIIEVPEGSGDAAMAADVTIEAALIDGGVDIESKRYDVPVGSVVELVVESDQEELVHVHGYDLYGEVGPGKTARISFEADSPGTFEVEFEESGRFLVELLVR